MQEKNMNRDNIKISIVIPAYNEELRIAKTLEQVMQQPFLRNFDLEVVVVDDGSRDQTSSVVRSAMQQYPKIRLVQNERNLGKGFSVRRGMMAAEGDFLFFADADNSTPIEEFYKLFVRVDKGECDVAIGSRGLKESEVRVRQLWVRQFMGKVFNFFVRMLILRDFQDTQCGFKCFSRKAAKEIFPLQRIFGFAFDVELLTIARSRSFCVKEVPVVWINSPQSKVSPFKDAACMFFDLFRIKFNIYRGLYNKP